MNRLPNFFLVGAAKAGTTSLYRYLDQHPEVYMSPIKEPHYFSEEIRFGNFCEHMRTMPEAGTEALRTYLDGPVTDKFSGGPVTEWRDYLKLFGGVRDERAIGEASTCYLWSPTAPARIAEAFPNARILMILRDPAERAFSQYRHMLSFASRRISFSEFIDAGIGAGIAAGLPGKAPQIGEDYPCLQFGFYHGQVLRYLSLFSRERIHIGFYSDFAQWPHAYLRDVCGFLGIDPEFRFDAGERHMQATVPQSYALNRALKGTGLWRVARALSPRWLRTQLRRAVYQAPSAIPMPTTERQRLIEYYRRDIESLGELLIRDLSAWLDPEPPQSHRKPRSEMRQS